LYAKALAATIERHSEELVYRFSESHIATVIAAVITSNLRLAAAPGNVRLPARSGGLSKASVVNVSQPITIDKAFLSERMGRLNPRLLAAIDDGYVYLESKLTIRHSLLNLNDL
jgi:hypothetical protein